MDAFQFGSVKGDRADAAFQFGSAKGDRANDFHFEFGSASRRRHGD